jgi:hypothetical protein
MVKVPMPHAESPAVRVVCSGCMNAHNVFLLCAHGLSDPFLPDGQSNFYATTNMRNNICFKTINHR